MKKTKENQLGITMIALIVTIIVLLILAGISIATLNGDSGIIKKSKEAKEQTEISEEKEVVDRATVQAMENNKKGDLIENELQEQLDKIVSSGKTEVTDTGEEFEILFRESNRYYIVDEEGNILEQQTIEKMEYAGDITKNGQYDGSAEKPYQISCIEDLVALSNLQKGSGIIYRNNKIEDVKNIQNIYGKHIELTKDLNFKSNYSYADSSRIDFGDLNTNGTIENIKEELTNTSEGCIGFTTIGNVNSGCANAYFNGKNHIIKNIYIHQEKGSVALLYSIKEIRNLKLTGNIINDTWEAGGIVCNASIIENCVNYANVTGYNFVGGICTGAYEIKNCSNYGNIISTGSTYAYGTVGGIGGTRVKKYVNCINYGQVNGSNTYVGGICGCITASERPWSNEAVIFESCENYGVIEEIGKSSWKGTGGIIGGPLYGKFKFINTANYGAISGGITSTSVGGLIGNTSGLGWDATINIEISNCVNFGDVYSQNYPGGIIGLQGVISQENTVSIKNTYNIGKISGKNIGDIIGRIDKDERTNTKTEFENVYYSNKPDIAGGTLTSGSSTLKTKEEMHSQEFINLLNQNIGSNSDWKKWKLGEKGYPVLDI